MHPAPSWNASGASRLTTSSACEKETWPFRPARDRCGDTVYSSDSTRDAHRLSQVPRRGFRKQPGCIQSHGPVMNETFGGLIRALDGRAAHALALAPLG